MASKECKIGFQVGFVILLLLILFFIGRPIFWKLSAILHDKETLTLAQQGISDVLMETRKRVGLYQATNRRLLRYQVLQSVV